jgi:hypothetical protein
MSHRGLDYVWALVVAIGILPGVSHGADDKPAEDPLVEEMTNLAKQVRNRCEFSKMGIERTKLVAHPEPVLRWSNPTAGRVFGNVCVWTEKGRPLVVASIYKSPSWGATLEVCSLAENPVTGQFEGNEFWIPNAAGMKRLPLPTAEKPASVAPARLTQMRRLATKFAVHLDDTRGTEDKGVVRQLRILTQPLYRYPSAASEDTKADYLDGALFAFVEGTDPEVLLVLEATQTGDSKAWQYGLARMNRDALKVTFENMTVWTVPYRDNQSIVATEPYTFFSIDRTVLKKLLLP